MMHVNTWGVKGLIKLHSNLVGCQLSALKAAPTDIYWSVLLVPEGFSQISSENVAFLAKGIEVGMYSDYNPAFKLLTAEMRMC